jgi:hypothetical protein
MINGCRVLYVAPALDQPLQQQTVCDEATGLALSVP